MSDAPDAHDAQAEAPGDVPLLTQVADEEPAAADLERTLLERLEPEIDRVTGLALDGLRAELRASLGRVVREALAAAKRS